jgi:hypothetical protein
MTTNFRQQVVAIVATILVSTACLVGAVGPAAAGGDAGAVATRTLA